MLKAAYLTLNRGCLLQGKLNESKNIAAKQKVRRVLAIDGGGIRGIIPASVLAYIEGSQGRPINQLFDLIVGTSTGGILALGLSLRGDGFAERYSAQRMLDLYENDGPNIFEQSLWRKLRSVGGLLEEAYSHEALEVIFGRYFGAFTLECCAIPTVVTSYDIQNRNTVFLKSWSGEHSHILCSDAARATSAAPTYFEPAVLHWGQLDHTLVDGGVFLNSPSVSAFAEARKLFPDQPIALMSLGTGELTRPIPYEEARTWGSALWIISLLDCMLDGASKAADYQMRLLLEDSYLRLQTPLSYASDDMDDASRGNIQNLKKISAELIEQEHDAINGFFV